MYEQIGKRTIDICGFGLALILLIPLLLLVSVAIKLDTRGSLFFLQDRVGRGGKIFKIIKFRTMKNFEDSFDLQGKELSNSKRITKVGRLLRRYSIDEIPQLWNVFKGEMSLVGPRPMLPFQVERLSSSEKKRLLVRPGITGLAQVNGRNSISWQQKIEFDIEYVNRISFFLDISILIRTIKVVFSSEDIEFVVHDKYSLHESSTLSDVGYKKDSEQGGSSK